MKMTEEERLQKLNLDRRSDITKEEYYKLSEAEQCDIILQDWSYHSYYSEEISEEEYKLLNMNRIFIVYGEKRIFENLRFHTLFGDYLIMYVKFIATLPDNYTKIFTGSKNNMKKLRKCEKIKELLNIVSYNLAADPDNKELYNQCLIEFEKLKENILSMLSFPPLKLVE